MKLKNILLGIMLFGIGFIIIYQVISDRTIESVNNISETELTIDSFEILIGDDVVLNDGIKLVSPAHSIDLSDNSAALDVFQLDIYMQEKENIIFEDMNYGLRAFQKNTSNDGEEKWEEIVLRIIVPSEEVTLFSNLEDNQSPAGSIWFSSDLLRYEKLHDSIRFYISGIGKVTGRRYGAFIDVEVIQP